MTTSTTQSVTVDNHQADLLLWCIEQMSIDLSDNELDELAPVINTLDEITQG